MNIFAFAVRRPIATLMLMIGLTAIGIGALFSFSIDLFPNIDFPLAFIQTPYPGVDPAQMENIVTRKIEEEVNTVENIKTMTSTSFEGFSWIMVEFQWGTNIDLAAVDLREKVDIAKRTLPRDIEQVTVAKLDINSQPILDVSLGGTYDLKELRRIADKEIKPAFERVGGVANVEVFGGLQREIRVKVVPERLRALKLTINDVINGITADNQNTSVGNIVEGNFKYLIRSEGEMATPERLGNIIVKDVEGRPVYLSELATIHDSFKDIESVSRLNQQPSVSLSVKKEAGANPVEISAAVRKLLPRLEARYGGRMKITIGNDRSEFINNSIQMVKENATSGAYLAVIILFLFLKNYRSTLIIGLSIPLAVVMTFPFMFLHRTMTLNLMTLGGLALGIGMIVDNSIVVLENIYRLVSEAPDGESRREELAIKAADEVFLPITASTLTTIVVFLPIGFVPGFIGEIFINMSLTIVYSLTASLLVSMTLVPMMSSKILKLDSEYAELLFLRALGRLAHRLSPPLTGEWGKAFGAVLLVIGTGLLTAVAVFPGWPLWVRALAAAPVVPLAGGAALSLVLRVFHLLCELVVFPLWETTIMVVFLGLYKRLLGLLLPRWYLRLPYLAAMVGLFAFSLTQLPPLGFFPKMDRGIFVIHFETPEGTSVEKTDEITRRIEALVRPYGEVDKIISNTKLGEADITVVLTPKATRKRTTNEVIQDLRPKVEGIPGYTTIAYQEPKMGGPHGGKAVQIEVMGDDYEVIKQLCRQVASRVADVPGLKDLDDGVKPGRPEIKVEFDRERIRDLGVGLTTVANMARSLVFGTLAGKYKELNEEFDIRVEAADRYKDELDKFSRLEIPLEKNKAAVLGQVAKIWQGRGFTKVERKNLKRIIKVQADIAGRSMGEVMADVQKRLEGFPLPNGYQINFGGENEEMMEGFRNLGIALLASIALVYMIMAAQYESLSYPFVIMFTIPLSFIGVVAGLRLGGFDFSITAMIGVIMLAGIVVNNGIILIEYINQRRGELKEDKITAAIQSGLIRFRPIWMTVSTTVLGMLPLALGIGAGSDFYQPLAITVIGGLTMSTVLTLTFIPALYILIDDIVERVMGVVRKYV
ncbi:MAG: efflux RND transporter permease subunit [Candidatus Riflebacteria bacterium]|nr:efflux RND transporter permease subunit [Candidatus Riflebacteria bacterium]